MIEPIVIKVTDKVPELVSGPDYVVCDNSDYTVVWQLDEEWAQFEHRTMQVNYKDGTYERVLFTGDTCALPAIPVPGPVHVGLFAGDIRTTRPARLLAVRSATTDSGEERDPMPNGYAQAIKALDAKLDKNQGANNAGKAMVVDAEGNVVPGEVQGSGSYTLPVASPTQLGGVKPVAKTDAMTKSIGVDDNGGLYTEPAEVFYIDLEGSAPFYTCPVAMADIKAAYEAGKVLECRCAIATYTTTLPLFLPMPSANTWIFSGAGELTAMGFSAQSLTVAIVNGTVQASDTRLATMWDKLPNPNALTITSGDTTVTYNGSKTESIDIPAGVGETWERIADIALTTDTSIYELADMGTWAKVKVMMKRPSYVSGLNKNVWFRAKSNQNAEWYTICYLIGEYGYVSWEVNVEVTNLFITGYKIGNNNPNAVVSTMSNVAKLLGDVLPGDLTFAMTFVDTSVIQDGDTVTVLGVRR